MITIVTQNSAIINMDNITAIYADVTEDNRVALVADEKYLLGHFNSDEDILNVIYWIVESIGAHKDGTNLNLVIPQADSVSQLKENNNE